MTLRKKKEKGARKENARNNLPDPILFPMLLCNYRDLGVIIITMYLRPGRENGG
jgi:hypothetical protein